MTPKIRRGNPKLTLFFFAFLPQFVTAGPGSTLRMLELSGVAPDASRQNAPTARYQRVLAQFPEFAPAQRELALLYAKDKARRDDAFALATQAYRALPKDAAIAQLLGELSYDRKDYRRAVQLLQESDSRNKLNPQGRYYLGLAYKASGQSEKAKSALEQAVGAGLPAAMAQDARRSLAELKSGR